MACKDNGAVDRVIFRIIRRTIYETTLTQREQLSAYFGGFVDRFTAALRKETQPSWTLTRHFLTPHHAYLSFS